MHFDLWKVALLLAVMTANIHLGSSKAYPIEESNTMTLRLKISLADYNADPTIAEELYTIMANLTATNCTQKRQICETVTDVNRKKGEFTRNITKESFQTITQADVHTMFAPKEHQSSTYSGDITAVNFYVTLPNGIDYLKWTELVSIAWYYNSEINNHLEAVTGIPEILFGVPESYIAKVIAGDLVIPMSILGTLMFLGLLLFIMIVLLAPTRFCKTSLSMSKQTDMEKGSKNQVQSIDKVTELSHDNKL